MLKSILIVDDNGLIRRAVKSIIESQLSFVVCQEAADGLEGIEKVKESKPDLVILDLSMPRMDGLEAAAALRKITADMPIILFTIHGDTARIREAHRFCINSVVCKADPIDTLLQEIKRLVRIPVSKSAASSFTL